MAEFVDGFQFLSELKKEVSIFGSARTKEGDPEYKKARKLAYLLGKAGFSMVTGGGPGIMEAANRGAKEAGADSIGLNIQLPREQRANKYVSRGIAFHYFFSRKVMLSAAAQAYVFFPGGFGTLDEMTELVTLIQTKKMEAIPIILVGKKFWTPFLKWVQEDMIKNERVSPEDEKIYKLVDSPEEAFKIIKSSKERTVF